MKSQIKVGKSHNKIKLINLDNKLYVYSEYGNYCGVISTKKEAERLIKWLKKWKHSK